MTETASGAGARKTRGDGLRVQRKGLTVERVYTTPGVHPYDEVTWERRDVVQTNWKTGETIFEQKRRGVPRLLERQRLHDRHHEVLPRRARHRRARVEPEAAHRPGRAHLHQGRQGPRLLRHRRRRGGLRARADLDAAAPGLQLQLAGLVQRRHRCPAAGVSACFILAVDDSMDSILNWYKEEGFIFKGGSGAGLNLSRIRSSKELLSAPAARRPARCPSCAARTPRRARSSPAGRPGGPRRWSCSTWTTPTSRSSSRPRRARRTRSARSATPGSTWTSAAATSPACSTRTRTTRSGSATSSCGRSRTASAFGLRGPHHRRGASRPSTPRSCSRKMAKAAWECADPGIQYDDTINDWHTTPESGRITASNPCSEYMHLDNSSCNLASLNLLKFLTDEGTFDAETFVKAVEIVITAMDISICFADFPTRGDRRHHPPVPPARHRLREPRRAAHGRRPRVRLRRRACAWRRPSPRS